MSKITTHMPPQQMKDIQAMKDKATRAWKPKVDTFTKRIVAQAVATALAARDRKRAYMVSQGQMRGGFPAD